ncbi:MAG: pyruvate formate lyase family protein [Blautia faecis]
MRMELPLISRLRVISRYGNDDDRADEIARNLLSTFMDKLKHIHTYRDSKPTTLFLPLPLTLFGH